MEVGLYNEYESIIASEYTKVCRKLWKNVFLKKLGFQSLYAKALFSLHTYYLVLRGIVEKLKLPPPQGFWNAQVPRKG